jgi:hypothetical protein
VIITILEQATGGMQGFSIVLTGAVMVVVVLFFPKGLISLWKRKADVVPVEDKAKKAAHIVNQARVEVSGEHVSKF